MSEQKVVICKDLKSELQDFLSSLKYDKLFILMDTNTKEKCFPLVEDIPAFQKAPILVMDSGDIHPIIIAAKFHGFYEYLHPFRDGNGRLGRMFTNFILLKKDHPDQTKQRHCPTCT